jgi:hypothetical protein
MAAAARLGKFSSVTVNFGSLSRYRPSNGTMGRHPTFHAAADAPVGHKFHRDPSPIPKSSTI